MRPDLIKSIVDEKHEVASHGYNHVRYPTLSHEEREEDLALSLQTFRRMGVKVSGFRAPYDNYTDDMPVLIDKYGLDWDGGFGYRENYREKNQFFRLSTNGGETRTTFIPLNIMSDDLMIDNRGWGPSAVALALKREVKEASTTQGVIMFDLHPIRMGQEEYATCLLELAEYAQEIGGWVPTPTEAVGYWSKHGRWKSDHDFCLLLTGDIDNWVFADYLRRIIWRRG
jgi:peptidoglycan/xylan/chitin deacetylase (PgdA/CDA1 family)